MASAQSNRTDLCPIRLTERQRRAIAELLPHLKYRLRLREKNAKSVSLTLLELGEIEAEARDRVYKAFSANERNRWEKITQITQHAVDYFNGIGAIPTSERIYQFQISLRNISPLIWRRIQVRDCTLDRFHQYIQLAMGWTDIHLHEFDIGGQPYADPGALEDTFHDIEAKDSRVTRLRDVVPPSGKRFQFLYTYDFGDVWEHEVLFEGCLRASSRGGYPICLEGERACPPEDIGGPIGYEIYLEALADPNHEEHEDWVQWCGSFDPEAFDENETTEEMRRGMSQS